MAEHHNSVELVGIYGSDETHALSAWTSTSRELTDEKRARIGKMIERLAADGHTSVFEKSSLHFLVTTDIASHLHLVKHRIGVSINAESARYKELKDDKFYVPEDWPEHIKERLIDHAHRSFELYHQTLVDLELLGYTRKRAKESARFFNPYATQLTADVMFNFRSFAHFVNLRADDHAQKEIQDIAKTMLRLVHQTGKFNLSISAFGFEKYL